MTQRESRFFEGVAIATHHALPETNPRSLSIDAGHLASFASKRIQSSDRVVAIDEPMVMAFAWVDQRRRDPKGELDVGNLHLSLEQQQIPVPDLHVARTSALKTKDLIADEALSSLVSGAQTSLSVLKPGYSADLFIDDFDVIERARPDLETIYLTNGVPRSIIPELITHEYVSFRLANPSLALGTFSGGFGPRLSQGLIDITTDPSPADIWVDNKSMSQQSPTLVIASAGTRTIKGIQGSLQAEQGVKVNIANTVVVNLKLV